MLQIPKDNPIGFLIANKKELIEMKKSAAKEADCTYFEEKKEASTIKAANDDFNDSDREIKRTIIGNTYYWMDSHDDVHVANCFKKSIEEKTPWHLHDHVFQVVAKVGTIDKIYEKYVDWTALGVAKSGQTQCLLADTIIKKEMNSDVFNQYLNGEINQHSVGMRYVKIELAVNNKDYKEEFANWNTYISLLGNPERANEKGYFWVVKEAKLIEISCVLDGSNSLTGVLSSKSEDEIITENEPPEDTQKQPNKSRFASIGSKLNHKQKS